MAVAALFFLSGASSLAYEVVWVKVLTLHFGSSAWSISTVVASFMAGLGAGCALAGRRSERIRRPLRAYALLELGIVLFGSISIPLLNGLDSVIGPLHQLLEGHAAGFALARFFVSFIVLLIPTFLMGASLPVLVVGLASEGNFEKRVACLYGVNTLGGAAGVLVTGLWLLPARGISGTVEVAVAVGLLVTALAFGLDRFASVRPRMVEAMPPASGGSPPGSCCLPC